MRCTLETIKKHMKERGFTKREVKKLLQQHQILWENLAGIPNITNKEKELECFRIAKRRIKNGCFLCEISMSRTGYVVSYEACLVCPVKWGARTCEELNSPYFQWKVTNNAKRKEKIATKIANLPLKKAWMDFLYQKRNK